MESYKLARKWLSENETRFTYAMMNNDEIAIAAFCAGYKAAQNPAAVPPLSKIPIRACILPVQSLNKKMVLLENRVRITISKPELVRVRLLENPNRILIIDDNIEIELTYLTDFYMTEILQSNNFIV